MNKEFVSINEKNTEFCTKTKSGCVAAIIEAHMYSSMTMDEMLENTCIMGFSIKDIADIYASCVKYADNHLIVRFTDGTNENTLSDQSIKYITLEV